MPSHPDQPQHAAPVIGVRAKLVLAAVGLVVGLGLSEVAARVVFPTPPQPAREPQILYQAHPEIGFLHVPGQTGWLDDGLATINALGLRGDLPETPKPERSIRVLAIGDSTTFGWGVGDAETYPVQLEKLLTGARPRQPLSVVNGGVGAYDLEHEARLLRHFAPSLRPDIVLVGLFWNDLPYEAMSPDGPPPAPAAPATPAAAVESAPAEPAPKPFRIGNQPSRLNLVLRTSRLLFALRHAWLAVVAPTAAATNQVQWEMAILEGRESEAIEYAWRSVEATLAAIQGEAVAAGSSVGVVVMPIRAQVEGDYPRAAYQTRVGEIARSLDMFVVDPLPLFAGHADEGLFIPYDRMHFTARGNALVARAAFEALRSRPELNEGVERR